MDRFRLGKRKIEFGRKRANSVRSGVMALGAAVAAERRDLGASWIMGGDAPEEELQPSESRSLIDSAAPVPESQPLHGDTLAVF